MDLAKKMNAETEAEFLEWLFDGSRLSPETAAVKHPSAASAVPQLRTAGAA